MEIYVDIVKGSDELKSHSTPETPFKTFDIAYQKTREVHGGVITLKVIGSHEMTLDSYYNMNVENSEDTFGELILSRNDVSITNCVFNVSIKIKMDTSNVTINTNGSVIFSKKMDITEKRHKGYGEQPDKTIIKNNGKLLIMDQVNIKADRVITFIENDNMCESIIPDVESCGGSLFVSNKGKFVKLYSKETSSDIKINYKYNTGMMLSSKISPKFSIYNGYGPLLCDKISFKILYHGTEEQCLFNVQDSIDDFIYPGNLGVDVDSTTPGFFYNSRINVLKGNVKLCNLFSVKLVSTELSGVTYKNPDLKSVKEITKDYVLVESEIGKVLITCADNVKLIIPKNIEIEKLYVKKMGSSNYVVTIISELLAEPIILNNKITTVKLFKYNGKLHIKYKC